MDSQQDLALSLHWDRADHPARDAGSVSSSKPGGRRLPSSTITRSQELIISDLCRQAHARKAGGGARPLPICTSGPSVGPVPSRQRPSETPAVVIYGGYEEPSCTSYPGNIDLYSPVP